VERRQERKRNKQTWKERRKASCIEYTYAVERKRFKATVEREAQQYRKSLEEVERKTAAHISLKYNCTVDPKLSALENAINILGDTPSMLHLSNVTNLAFHDLTPENHHVPPGANLLLGLGQKFIPTLRRTTGSKELNEHLFRFRRDLYRAVFWGEDSEEEKEEDAAKRPKLKLPSKWTPSESEIPSEITHRVSCFFDEMEKVHVKRTARPNLRPFELKLLKALKADHSTVIANADKGLGPVAVELHKYIADALKHLEEIPLMILSQARKPLL
jgi:hypothetical protein